MRFYASRFGYLLILAIWAAPSWGQYPPPQPLRSPRSARPLPNEAGDAPRELAEERAPARSRSIYETESDAPSSSPLLEVPGRNDSPSQPPRFQGRANFGKPPQPVEPSNFNAPETPSQPLSEPLSQAPAQAPVQPLAAPPAFTTTSDAEPLLVAPASAEKPVDDDDKSVIAGAVSGVEWISEEALEKLAYVWNYEITQVDGKPIRTGTIVCGLVLFAFGLFASKLLAWWFGGRFLPRLGMHKSAVAPVRSISYYVLLATFTMLSLRLINVPLTAFTFLGGALAVGVGFGSQNLCNNFISGLILLAEQPIREGDSIQIDAYSGTVTKIGPRSTRITTGDNHEVIVPNSSFLQSNVVNRTLTDDRVRGKIKVGVAYGTHTRTVEQLLLQAADEHEDVRENPPPSVTFADFGDNAMHFELQFWLNCRSAKGETESDLRYRVDELFRQEGIIMAYPQRDVHLNVGQPVEVRLAGAPLSLVRELNRSAA